MDLTTIIQSLENKIFVANEYVESASTKRLTVVDPATGDIVSSGIANASQDDVDKAVAAAEAAIAPGSPWRRMTAMQRAQIMWKAAELIECDDMAHVLSLLEAKSFGRPYSFHKAIDVTVCAENFRYNAGWADKIPGDSQLRDGDMLRVVRREPVGVVVGIMAWNGPISSVGMKAGPALAAGNCVILKPSEKTPLGTLYLARVFAEAGFPPGVVQVLPGAGDLGSMLAHHMRVRHISFTGSVGVGKLVQEAASKSNLKRVTLELGGKSPIVVFEDADVEKAAFWAAMAIASNSGQYCVAGSRVYVQDTILDKFRKLYLDQLAKAAQGKGLPIDTATTYGPVADQSQFKRIREFIEEGKTSATITLDGTASPSEKGYYITPTVFEEPKPDAKVYKEEIFGPVSVLKAFATEHEVVGLANNSDFGLMASVFTRDLDRAARMSEALEAGTVCINTSMAINARAPFGGQKQSGYGSEGGLDGVLAYTQVKTVVLHVADVAN